MNAKLWICMAAGISLIGCSDEGTTDYDPGWGGDQFVPNGKADLVDVAEPIEYGASAEGEVDSSQLDLYRLDVTNGDEFKITMDVLDGDLAPDASLFRSSGGSIGSENYSVEPNKLTKNFLADSSGTLLLVARAFRNQGAGAYKIAIECTGGPCNGEFIEPDPDDVDLGDALTCVQDAFDCAFADLPSYNGRVGETRAASIFNGCLAREATWEGVSCAGSCDADNQLQDICTSIIDTLPFYADQPAECLSTVDSCMDTCLGDEYWDHDEPWDSPFAMCWTNGFNSSCSNFSRQMSACGGPVQNETAVCYESCYASSGVFMDDLDVICEEECGTCGIQCQRELDWGGRLPADGLVGDIEEKFYGEVDPFVLGDACLVWVRVHQEGDGELTPGVYGLIPDDDGLCNGFYSEDAGDPVYVSMSQLDEVTDADVIDAASSAGSADKWFRMTGDFDRLD